MTLAAAAQDEAIAWLRLTLTPDVHESEQRALLKAFGSPAAALAASVDSRAVVVKKATARALATGAPDEAIERALRWLEEPNHHLVTLGGPHFPRALLDISDPPNVLYVIGRLELLNAQSFAIVGSRNATSLGMRDAESLARALSEAGFTIVSGLALGIDTAAHRGGLAARGSSVAVMATGADGIYPARNMDLAQSLAAQGALITEFPLGAPPIADHFKQRNRLISGLARGVLVVEAAYKSGSLITAHCAIDQGRDVFAIPGSIHSPLSKGCHRLIKEGAKLVESAEDVLAELGIAIDAPSKGRRKRIDAATRAFLEAMGYAPVSIDAIAGQTGGSAAEVAARLAQLEVAGLVAGLAGGLFQRLGERVIE
jgi:DNA processing protein